MWEQSLLTSSGQVQALRLLSEWWDASRRGRPPRRPRRAGAQPRPGRLRWPSSPGLHARAPGRAAGGVS
jgi:hypothetical protein